MADMTRAVSAMSLKPVLTAENDATAGMSIAPIALNPADKTYSATTTPPGTKYAADSVSLSGSGAATHTIDLTDLTDVEGIALTGQGLEVQEFRVQADSDNAAVIIVSGGDSDPYELFGSGNSMEVTPGGANQARFNDGLVTIDGTTAAIATDIKFAGSGGDSFSYEIIMG